MGRYLTSLLIPLWATLLTGMMAWGLVETASASDGVLEINQACATGPGCFSGDSPGFPVTITFGGSYRLTSDLSSNFLLGPPSADFIRIDADHVHLDLNGFALRCRHILTGAPCTGSTVSGIHAIHGSAWIGNGTIFGMPHKGIASSVSVSLRIEDLFVDQSASIGIEVGEGSRIERSVVQNSGIRCIQAFDDSILVGNTVRNCATVGIAAIANSIVRGNVATGCGGAGIAASEGSLVQGNTSASNNIGFRLRAEVGANVGGLARDNVTRGNSTASVQADPGWVLTSNVFQ